MTAPGQPAHDQVQVQDQDEPRGIVAAVGPPDRLFRAIAYGGGVAVLVVMAMVGAFLAIQAWSAFGAAGWSFFTTQAFEPDSDNFGIGAVLPGTVLIAVVAIAISLPLSIGAALYVAEYAPARIRSFLVSLIDLMAAVPSVIYGLWGVFLLGPHLLVVGPKGEGLPRWLATYFSWIPFLRVEGFEPREAIVTANVFTSSTFIAGVVVAMMVTPIACSVMREVFSQAPPGEREGALALGSTRWGMIRAVVLPFARGGIIGGTMLGLGRALGETIAVFMVISPAFVLQPRILENGANSVSALIALRFGEASPKQIAALFAAGLVLFGMTLLVNFGASAIIARSRSGATSEA